MTHQQVGGMGKEDVANEKWEWDEDGRANSDDSNQPTVQHLLSVTTKNASSTEVEAVVAQESDADEGQCLEQKVTVSSCVR